MRTLIARTTSLAAAALLGACATASPPPSPVPAAPSTSATTAMPAAAAVPPTCPGVAEMAEAARRYLAKNMLPLPSPSLTMEGAACGQARFLAALSPSLGRTIGYKAGLTNDAVQKRFGIDRPLLGRILERMLIREGDPVPANIGVRPFVEADLMVEVGSSAIHGARTPEEVLPFLRAVHPYIEIPDMAVADPSNVTPQSLVLYDVGARLGVLGSPLPVEGSPGLAEALRTMTVRTVDGSGKELGVNAGSAILSHPLQAVIWIAAELRKEGVTLKPGDLLSLGAFSAGPFKAGMTVRVTYEGLPGNPTIEARFP